MIGCSAKPFAFVAASALIRVCCVRALRLTLSYIRINLRTATNYHNNIPSTWTVVDEIFLFGPKFDLSFNQTNTKM